MCGNQNIIRSITLSLLPLATANFRSLCRPFAYAYMDPIVNPKQRSGHEHTIGGTLGFDDETLPRQMRANQTTCDVIGDKSNYWVPTLYRTDLGPKKRIPGNIQAYYEFYKAEAAIIDPTVLATNISMVVGRAAGDATFTMAHINFVCRINGLIIDSPAPTWHPTMKGCEEIRIDYTFPSCWNGKKYSPDQSHVAYPDQKSLNGECPATHPKKFVQLRLEQRYILDVPASWTDGAAPFVFSTGAANTAHADATLLWDVPTLTALVKGCQGPTTKCTYPGVSVNALKVQNAIAANYVVPTKYRPADLL